MFTSALKTFFGSGVVATVTDAFFNLVTLLLPGNGTNGAQNNTFLDSSSNNFTITRNGNTTQGTFSPFSQTGWSNFFNGTNAYLTGTSPDLSGNWTVEFMFYPTVGSTQQTMVSFNNGAGAGINIWMNTSQQIVVDNVSTAQSAFTGGTITLNAWNYIAITRSGTTTTGYINGSLVGTNTFSPLTTSAISIGRLNAGPLYYVNGYISNLRVSNGTVRTITTPTAFYTNDANTSILTCQDNRFKDNSTNAYTITVNGTPSVQAFSPFAPTAAYSAATVGGSGYFDGTGDSLASTTDFESSTSISTFTIEGWVYPTTFSTLINVIGGMVVSSGDQKSIAAEVNTSGQVALYWFDGSVKRCTGNTVMQLNAWNYFAIVVTSNAIAIYVNKTTADTLSGTTTLTSRTQSTDLGVGAYYNNNSPAQYFNGYLASVRYSTVARTISSIPTAPLSSDSDVRWLLNFTNAGITDATAKNVLETVGNAQISTTQSKFGGSSMYFDGTGDYLISSESNICNFGLGDFTIEFWLYLNTTSGTQNIIDPRPASTTGAYATLYTSGGTIRFFTQTTDRITSSSVNTNEWFHVAVCRSGTSTKMFFNGTQTGNTYTDTNSYVSSRLVIGAGFANTSSITNAMNGYIDDLRISRYARYTANFTAPTSAFPLQ